MKIEKSPFDVWHQRCKIGKHDPNDKDLAKFVRLERIKAWNGGANVCKKQEKGEQKLA